MILRLSLLALALIGAGLAWVWLAPFSTGPVLRLGSTTSTKDSGLLDHLIPLYEAETGIEVIVIAKGTGAAIRDGLSGRVDALLVHNEQRERELVAQGYANSRRFIMSNSFLIVGPKSDRPELDQPVSDQPESDQTATSPDVLNTGDTLDTLLAQFAEGERGLFLSRGDHSGTHAAELNLWHIYGLDPSAFGPWYATTGTGMGQTLITANANGASTLVDSATWARHRAKGDLEILFGHVGQTTGDATQFPTDPTARTAPPANTGLENPYGYLALNPARIPGVQSMWAEDFGEWLAGPTGQAAIAAYLIDGMQVFKPESSAP